MVLRWLGVSDTAVYLPPLARWSAQRTSSSREVRTTDGFLGFQVEGS